MKRRNRTPTQKNKEFSMDNKIEEKKELDQNSEPTTSNIRRIPKKGELGYDEFMRELFRSAGSNMLRDDEI